MIIAAHINSFRSCKDVELNGVGNLLVLIGHNGAGKSNILKAILWVAKNISNKINSEETKEPWSSANNGDVLLKFYINKSLYEYQIKYSSEIDFEGDNPQIEVQYEETLTLIGDESRTPLLVRNGESIHVPALDDKQFEVSNNISAITAMQSLLSEGNNFRMLLESIARYFSNVVYYPLELGEQSITSVIITQGQYQQWLAKPDTAIDPDLVMQMKILRLFLTNKDKYDELVSLLGQDGLEIIDNIYVQEFGANSASADSKSINKFYLVRFTPSGHATRKTFGITDLSFGTRRVLNFVLSLVYDAASVALVEQIEDGIHEGLVDKLVQLIRDYADDAQFILASHSTAVFDQLKPDEIRIVELNNGVTNIRSLTEVEIAAAVSYMKEDGSFSDFLQSI